MVIQQKKYIAYYRVSTQQQGNSGLGLEAQQKTIEQYCKDYSIIQSFTDIESGKRNTRPELLKAIEVCKQTNSILVIAKLDRLSRNVEFIANLMNSKIDFVACDLPEADKFTIHIFAALAEKEREMISTRTKAALKALKDRGVKLGGPNTTAEHCKLMRSQRKPKEYNKTILFIVNQLSDKPLNYIADELNRQGLKTLRNKTFTSVQVFRLKNYIAFN